MCSKNQNHIIEINNSDYQKHIDILQGIINRMAANSSHCKTWCVTLISAIMIFSLKEKNGDIALLSFIPLILFFYLDSYYLSLEKDFRDSFNEFVKKLHEGTLTTDSIFKIRIKNNGFIKRPLVTFKAAFDSPSTLPFYGLMFVLLLLCRRFL